MKWNHSLLILLLTSVVNLAYAANDEKIDTDTFIAEKGDIEAQADYVEALFNKRISGAVALDFHDHPQNWSDYAGISFTLENPDSHATDITIIVESLDEADRVVSCRRKVALPATTKMRLPFFFSNGNAGPYWGMRGIPIYHRLAHAAFANPTANIHLEHITELAIEPDTKEQAAALRLYQCALFPAESELAHLVPHPFIDIYGQYIHEDWPDKIHNDAELKTSWEKEQHLLEASPKLACMDTLGGWQEGPQLEATGWFRVEKVNGRWWFVTPEGHLFLSVGVNCVHYGDSTFIEGRDDWFEGLPDPEGPYAKFWGNVSGVHSMAEPIDGKGRTFNHYGCNLKRKYGDTYVADARDMAYDRLRAWGFTTIGNWSDGDTLIHSPMPFTVTGGSGHARALAGSVGYWGKMKDVFDPDFVVNTNNAMEKLTADYRDNPKVVGFFVDNEMSWSGIAPAALASPADQPARKAFIEMLQEKYKDVAALNTAWDTEAKDWVSLQMPTPPNRQCRKDCDAFEYRFARKYFDTVADALKRFAPNHLYLGCRFTPVYCPEPVLRACVEVVDVVSYNMYSREIAADRYCDFGKPVIFGEFHFGATDRGMFHTGLQAATDQNERAALYAGYIKSLALHPAVIGAHWFKYSDQPTTGRTLDGENYNIGLVNIADVPYPELIDAAKDIHEQMYSLRYKN